LGEKLKVGIIGKGNMGTAFSTGLGNAGHSVEAAGRDPAELRRVVQDSDVVILAVPYAALPTLVKEVGAALRGKVVVDITNTYVDNFTFVGDLARSGAEKLAAGAPGARVVKAFNTVFAGYLAGGQLNGETLTAFVAGDDNAAKGIVMDLARDLGLEPVDAGNLRNAGWLEAVGFFNLALHYTIGWEHGLRLVRGKSS
jgi:8-hydroxy-5-deazaflavin:NADPH oxidoreductase